MSQLNGSVQHAPEPRCNSTPVLSFDSNGSRVWTVTTIVVCAADRHDTISAYKNHHCRCPKATAKAVDYERRRNSGCVLPTQPADLTMRRLQALAVIGWPSDVIAPMVNRNRVSISEIRRGGHLSVTGRTARDVHRVYRQLHDQPGPSDRIRSYARRQGWSGPSLLLLYDDVDEVVVSRALCGEIVSLRRNERLTVVQVMHAAGRTYNAIAAALRIPQRQVHRDLADLGLIGTVEVAS